MPNFKDLKFAINFLKKNGCKKYAILQCVSAYPSPLKEQNLATINKLKEIFKCPVGISDHTIEMIAPLTSVSIGASIIEKHFNDYNVYNFGVGSYAPTVHLYKLKDSIKNKIIPDKILLFFFKNDADLDAMFKYLPTKSEFIL